jgi:hypothetical protein
VFPEFGRLGNPPFLTPALIYCESTSKINCAVLGKLCWGWNARCNLSLKFLELMDENLLI